MFRSAVMGSRFGAYPQPSQSSSKGKFESHHRAVGTRPRESGFTIVGTSCKAIPAPRKSVLLRDSGSLLSGNGASHEFVKQGHGERCLAIARRVDHPLADQ